MKWIRQQRIVEKIVHHKWSIFLIAIILLFSISFFWYRNIPVINIEKESNTEPQIEQVMKKGKDTKTFYCKYKNVVPNKTYPVSVKITLYGKYTGAYLGSASYDVKYKPEKEEGFVKVIVPISDEMRRTASKIRPNYECTFTILDAGPEP